MKLKASKKEFKGLNVLRVGYCKLQYLLQYKQPFAYSSGVNGWSCDYYDLDGVIISTGYQPIGKQVNNEAVATYEDIARKVSSGALDYKEKEKLIDNLIKDFVNDSNV